MAESELHQLLATARPEDIRPLFLSVARSIEEIRMALADLKSGQEKAVIHDEKRWEAIEKRVSSLEAFRIRGLTVISLVGAGVGPAIWIWAAHH